VIRWVSQFYATGSVAPGKMGGHKPKTISGAHHDWLVARCREREFTLRGLVAELAERGCHVDYRSVWNFVHAEDLSYKKTVVASERDRPDVARRRAQWQAYQGRINPERLVFIDETWTKTNMAPLRGWALRGQRLTAKVPHGHWKTMTFLRRCATTVSRPHGSSIGPINGEAFQTYVEAVLVPHTRARRHRHDGQSRQPQGKTRASGHPVGRRQAVLPAQILPGPEPDRAGLRQAQAPATQEAARTVEAVCTAVGKHLDAFTPKECANYFKNAGYDPT
jgi:hypothetical protein